MRFAKFVFWTAGVWGILVLTPLYFLFDSIGRMTPPLNPAPITHPEFFYGFAGVGLVWQIAFLMIGSDPARFRPMMIPAVLEKLSYVLALVVLYLQNRIGATQALPAIPDGFLGVLFTIAFFRLKARPGNSR